VEIQISSSGYTAEAVLVVAFGTGDELVALLEKALEVEKAFESSAQWEAYVAAQTGDFQDMLFQMMAESQQHKVIVEQMISKVRTVHPVNLRDVPPREFNFRGKSDQEIMQDLKRTEELMASTYRRIRDALLESDTSRFIHPSDREDILEKLDFLISQEETHTMMVSSSMGMVRRIR
jgi:hypothetical protein